MALEGGLEVRAETFVTRFVSALGYYAETTYFVAKGNVDHVGPLKRASGFISKDGSFTYASLERREPDLQFSQKETWSWEKSPFQNTRELSGLKILVMLFSNWDNKDSRDHHRGSNTGVLESADHQRLLYFVNDWGQSLGSWAAGSAGATGPAPSFARQTPEFAPVIKDGLVQFGYAGQHTEGFRDGIRVDHAKWLLEYLGRVTDAQIRTGPPNERSVQRRGRLFYHRTPN